MVTFSVDLRGMFDMFDDEHRQQATETKTICWPFFNRELFTFRDERRQNLSREARVLGLILGVFQHIEISQKVYVFKIQVTYGSKCGHM